LEEEKQPVKKGPQKPLTTRQLIESEFPPERISLSLYKSNVTEFFAIVSKLTNLQIRVDPEADASLTLNLKETALPEAILSILTIYDLRIEKRENYFFVYRRKAQ
jgi:hypothetical protein